MDQIDILYINRDDASGFQLDTLATHSQHGTPAVSAAALNGEIVTDSESDNAEDYVGIASIANECAKQIVARKRKSLARRVCRIGINRQ